MTSMSLAQQAYVQILMGFHPYQGTRQPYQCDVIVEPNLTEDEIWLIDNLGWLLEIHPLNHFGYLVNENLTNDFRCEFYVTDRENDFWQCVLVESSWNYPGQRLIPYYNGGDNFIWSRPNHTPTPGRLIASSTLRFL